MSSGPSVPLPHALGRLPREATVRRAIAVSVGALLALYVFFRIAGIYNWDPEMGGWEANVVLAVQKMMIGQPLYQDPAKAPFEVVQYMPVYFQLCAGLGKLLHLDPLEPRQVFVLGRWLSLLFNLSTAALLLLLLRRFMVPFTLALVMAVGLLFSLHRTAFARPDSLYLLLAAASLAAYMLFAARVSDKWGRNGLWLSALAGCAAFFTKQSAMIVLAVPAFHLLFVMRDIRSALWFGTVCGAVLSAGLAYLVVHYGALPLKENVVTGLRNGVSDDLLEHVFYASGYATVLPLELLAGVLVAYLLRSADPLHKALAWALVLTFGFAVITGLKTGSRINYFHEHFFVLYFSLGLMASRLPADRDGGFWTALIVGLVLSHTMVRLWEIPKDVVFRDRNAGRPAYENARAITSYLKKERGLREGEHVFVRERGWPEHFLIGHSVLNEKDVVWHSPEQLYDYSAFHRAMDDGEVRFVITKSPRLPIHYLGRDHGAFTEVAEMGGFHILETTAHGAPH